MLCKLMPSEKDSRYILLLLVKMGNDETQGEDLIADFLEDKSIEFKRYKKN